MSELLATVKNSGEIDFSRADDANIPVSIFLLKINKDDNEYPDGHVWKLSADNFMPRKTCCDCGCYLATAPTREALVEVVKRYILPLYQNAITKLNGIIDSSGECLYYWGGEH